MPEARRDTKDILEQAREAFDLAVDNESYNRATYEDDTRFARLGEQWPAQIKKQREDEGRPCLTINKTTQFIRQVVNDQRLNKPAIKVHPADSDADVETAKIYNGLIRNIEYTSNADVAYDTGAECAVQGGFGYWRVGLDHAYDDAFDLDINIQRIANPLLVYGDPFSTAADSSDWNSAFIIENMPKSKFEATYHDAEAVDWEGGDYSDLPSPWVEDETVMVAEWWTREEVSRRIVKLADDTIHDAEWAEEVDPITGVPRYELLASQANPVVGERDAKTYKVTQRILTGAEELEKNDWPGRYIPIVPVYGDEIVIDGKRYFRSLIHDAKDAQRMFNYWRTTSTELVALAPKTPFIGVEGAFNVDAQKWATANTQSWPFIQHAKNTPAPQRQPFVGVPAGVLQEALNASDDMKAILGLYDASLGARSNETSGKAIMARQREGDVATFHFADNQSRAIRHTGRIIIDLIPHVYNTPRIVRVLGEDGEPESKTINKEVPVTDKNGQPEFRRGPDGRPMMDEAGQPIPITRVYDLTKGKYDLTVSSGPSFSTRREEAATQMMEMIRSFPQAAPIMGDLVAKNLDWPGADEIAERLKKLLPAALQGEDLPPELKKIIQEGKQKIELLEAENKQLKADRAVDAAGLKIDQQKADIDGFKAETDRIKAASEAAQGMMSPEAVQAIVLDTIQKLMNSPDVATQQAPPAPPPPPRPPMRPEPQPPPMMGRKPTFR